MHRFTPTLERVSQIAFIVMCVVVSAVGIQRLTPAAAEAPPARPGPFRAGEKITLHRDLEAGAAKATLVLGLSTNCRFCTASMPLYQRLTALDVVKDGRLRLGVVSLQAHDEMRKYLEAHHVAIGSIVPLADSGISLRGTPTAILVDRSGLVVNSWAGQLGPAEESALLSDVRRVSSR